MPSVKSEWSKRESFPFFKNSHVLKEKQGLKRVRLNFWEEFREELEYGWTFVKSMGGN